MMRMSRLIGVKWQEGEKVLNLLEQLPAADEPEARKIFLMTHLP
jgi:hypothetical protein